MPETDDTIRRAREIRRMFGGIAGTYDFLNHLLSLNQDRRWRARTAALPGADGPVLDVCAGTGDMAIAWAERTDGPVLGADFCEEMLVLGQKKGGAVRFLAADTLRLPFPSGHFGTVSAAFGIRNVSDLAGGIREMARVTRPGGRVVLLEFTVPGNPLFKAVYLLYFLFVLPFVGNLVSGTTDSAYAYLPRSVLSFPGREKLKGIMESQGLAEVEVHDLSLGIVNVLVGERR